MVRHWTSSVPVSYSYVVLKHAQVMNWRFRYIITPRAFFLKFNTSCNFVSLWCSHWKYAHNSQYFSHPIIAYIMSTTSTKEGHIYWFSLFFEISKHLILSGRKRQTDKRVQMVLLKVENEWNGWCAKQKVKIFQHYYLVSQLHFHVESMQQSSGI